MALDMTALTAKIERTVGIEESALGVIQELRAEVARLNDANTGDQGTMQAAIDALTSKLDAGGTRLAAAVAFSPADTGTADPGPVTGEAGTVADDPASVAAAEAVPQELHPGQPTPGVLDGDPNPTGTAASNQIPPVSA